MPILYEHVFGKSVEKTVGAEKYPTSVEIYLGPRDPYAPRWPPAGPTVKVGTEILIRIGIRSTQEGKWITAQGVPARVYHRIDTGAWEQIASSTWTVEDAVDLAYTLAKPGVHTFYVEWAGTDKYAGCRKAVKAFAR